MEHCQNEAKHHDGAHKTWPSIFAHVPFASFCFALSRHQESAHTFSKAHTMEIIISVR